MSDLVVRDASVMSGPDSVDIIIDGGRIIGLVPAGEGRGAEVIDCGGNLVLPGFVESHIHLDKAFLNDPQEPAGQAGGLADAIAETARRKASFTAENIRERASAVLERAVRSGTTALRAHTDVDPIIGLTGVEALLELREEWREVVAIQVVAFPQEGIERAPGTLALLREALASGADVVGGCPYNEDGLAGSLRHLEAVMDLAAEWQRPVDLHADFADDASDPRYSLASEIAASTQRHGLQGRVAVGHMTSLDSLYPGARAEVLAALADAGVSVVLLPATDLHLGGLADVRNVRRGVAPLRALWEAGVRTAYSSNNIRNAFTPSGRADMLDIGLLLARVAHLAGPADFARVLEMATSEAGAIIGLDAPLGIVPGAQADLVVTANRTASEVLLDGGERRHVISRGQLVFSERRERHWHGPARTLIGRTSPLGGAAPPAEPPP